MSIALPQHTQALYPVYTPWYRTMEKATIDCEPSYMGRQTVDKWLVDSRDVISSFAQYGIAQGAIEPQRIIDCLTSINPLNDSSYQLASIVNNTIGEHIQQALDNHEALLDKKLAAFYRRRPMLAKDTAKLDDLNVSVGTYESPYRNYKVGEFGFGLFVSSPDFEVLNWDLNKIRDEQSRLAVRKALSFIAWKSPYIEAVNLAEWLDECWWEEVGYSDDPESFKKFTALYNAAPYKYDSLEIEEMLELMELSHSDTLLNAFEAEIISDPNDLCRMMETINEVEAINALYDAKELYLGDIDKLKELINGITPAMRKDKNVAAIYALLNIFCDNIDLNAWQVEALGENIGDVDFMESMLVCMGDEFDEEVTEQKWQMAANDCEETIYQLTDASKVPAFINYLKQHLLFQKIAYQVILILE